MKGYTLIEVVVYVGILAVISVLIVGSTLSIYQAFTKTRIDRIIALNGDVAMETLIRRIRLATSTDPSSVFGTSPGVLKMNTGGTTETFSLSGATLQKQLGTNPAEDLTSSSASVTSLIFYATTTANSKMITVRLTIQAGSGVFQKEKNFYGSAVMRGAY